MSQRPTPRHYVTFFSPGTFFSEKSEAQIAEWDPVLATQMSGGVTERHGAKPFAFRFETRLVAGDIDDGYGGKMRVEPKTIKTSALYHLIGTVETYDQVAARGDKSEETLRFNMSHNDMPLVVVTRNSYMSVQEYREKDVVVDADGRIVDRGDSEERMAYRREFARRVKAGEL
jgi:hypothetical protein